MGDDRFEPRRRARIIAATPVQRQSGPDRQKSRQAERGTRGPQSQDKAANAGTANNRRMRTASTPPDPALHQRTATASRISDSQNLEASSKLRRSPAR